MTTKPLFYTITGGSNVMFVELPGIKNIDKSHKKSHYYAALVWWEFPDGKSGLYCTATGFEPVTLPTVPMAIGIGML